MGTGIVHGNLAPLRVAYLMQLCTFLPHRLVPCNTYLLQFSTFLPHRLVPCSTYFTAPFFLIDWCLAVSCCTVRERSCLFVNPLSVYALFVNRVFLNWLYMCMRTY